MNHSVYENLLTIVEKKYYCNLIFYNSIDFKDFIIFLKIYEFFFDFPKNFFHFPTDIS